MGFAAFLLCRKFSFVFLNPFILSHRELSRDLRMQSCRTNFHWRFTHSFLFRYVSQPPPLLGTSFHRKERAVSPHQSLSAWEGNDARIPLSHPVISSASEKSFSLAEKQCMRVNKNGKLDIPRMWDTVFHVNGLADVLRKRQQQRSLGYARDDDTGGGIVLQRRRLEYFAEA